MMCLFESSCLSLRGLAPAAHVPLRLNSYDGKKILSFLFQESKLEELSNETHKSGVSGSAPGGATAL